MIKGFMMNVIETTNQNLKLVTRIFMDFLSLPLPLIYLRILYFRRMIYNDT